MAAPTYQDAVQAIDVSGTNNSIGINRPAGAGTGSRLVMLIFTGFGLSSINNVSGNGWTQVRSKNLVTQNPVLWVWTKRINDISTEALNYIISGSGSNIWNVILLSYTDSNKDVDGITYAASSTNAVAPSIIPTKNNATIILAVASSGSDIVTFPDGITTREDAPTTWRPTVGDYVNISGATGTKTSTIAFADNNLAYQLALVSTTTTITISRTLLWNIYKNILATRMFKWNTKGIATLTKTLLWNTKSTIVALKTIKWSVDKSILISRVLKWKINKQINAVYVVLWNTGAKIIFSKIIIWDTRQTILSLRIFRWNTSISVSSISRIFKWNIKQQINNSEILRWNTRQKILTSRIFKWNATGKFVTSVSFLWDVLKAWIHIGKPVNIWTEVDSNPQVWNELESVNTEWH